jgi:hypothetical protein
MINNDILKSLITSIKNNIKNKNIDTSSCFKIIILSIEIIENYNTLTGEEKKNYIILAIENIAKGEDNISGTEDDLLNETIVSSLVFILKNNYINEIIDIVFKASRGGININKMKIKNKLCCI